MKLGESQRGTLVPALVAFMVLAGVGVSLAGRSEPSSDLGTVGSWTSEVRSGHRGGDRSGPVAVGLDADPSGESGTADASTECAEALVAGDAALGRGRGLERAVEVILENCGRNPAAEGLLKALGRLQENQARHDEKGREGTPNPNANEHANEHANEDANPNANPNANEHANPNANEHEGPDVAAGKGTGTG